MAERPLTGVQVVHNRAHGPVPAQGLVHVPGPSMDQSHGQVEEQGSNPLHWALFGHAAFQYLRAACKLGVIELIHRRPGIDLESCQRELGIPRQPLRCVLLALTAMHLLEKTERGHRCRPVFDQIFRDGHWCSFVDIVEFEHHFAYLGEMDLTEAIRQGRNVGLQRFPGTGPNLYHRLAQTPHLQRIFFRYMSAWTQIGVDKLLEKLDLAGVRTAVDMGGGDATAAIAIARKHRHVLIDLIELPANADLARQNIRSARVDSQIRVVAGDFFTHPLPDNIDCFLFFHQLVIWPAETNVQLLKRAYGSLRPGGQVVILNSMSNDEQDGPLVAALDSAYFLSLPEAGGMIYTWSDIESFLGQAGFTDIKRLVLDCWTPQACVTARKQ